MARQPKTVRFAKHTYADHERSNDRLEVESTILKDAVWFSVNSERNQNRESVRITRDDILALVTRLNEDFELGFTPPEPPLKSFAEQMAELAVGDEFTYGREGSRPRRGVKVSDTKYFSYKAKTVADFTMYGGAFGVIVTKED